MKTIYIFIKSYFIGFSALLIIGIFLGVGWLASSVGSDDPSLSRGSLFTDAVNAHMQATLIPSVSENPVRQELNQQLAVVLSEDLSAGDRLKGARRGIELIEIIDQQIDASEHTANLLENAEADRGISSPVFSGEIAVLVSKLVSISSDIRGLSYRANFHTEQIFTRIIDDKGVLSDTHKRELNELIPLVEEQFDRRSNLYLELEMAHQELLGLLPSD